MHFYKLSELKGVLAVYTTTYNDKKTTSAFFKSTKIFISFSNQADLRYLSVWCHTDEDPSHDCLLTAF